MKVLVKFTEVVSDNYQGASGKVFNRKVLMSIDDETRVYQVFSVVQDRLIANRAVFYCKDDRELIRVTGVEILDEC